MLSDGSTLYVNEEGLYVFGPDDFNSIATDVAGLGGASHILMSGLLGPAVLVGPVSNDGYDTDVTAAGRAWVNRVAREASVKRRGSRKTAEYNGWANHATWNVAMWIGSIEDLYEIALESDDYHSFVRNVEDAGGMGALDTTPDGVAWTDPTLDIEALDEMIGELRATGSRRSSRRTAASDKLLTQLPDYRDTCGCSLMDGRCAKHSKMLGAIRNVYDNDNGPLFDSMWALSDGYGEPGWYPPGEGINWSGIRDSSTAAIEAMYAVATGGSRSGSRKKAAGEPYYLVVKNGLALRENASGGIWTNWAYGTRYPHMTAMAIAEEHGAEVVVGGRNGDYIGSRKRSFAECDICGGTVKHEADCPRLDKDARKKQARRRHAAWSWPPAADSNYDYSEYQRGQADGWDDGYASGMKQPGAKDRRYDWQMDPTSDYQQGYQDAWSEGFRSGNDERTGYGSPVAPDWFDPTAAGERWSDDW
jgi:hypothetical protein